MAYRIEYGPPFQPPQKKRSTTRLRIMTAACLLLFVLLVRQAWPEGTEKLRQFLLPGEPTVTQEAFYSMIEGIQDGVPMGDALTAFCQQIVDYEKAPAD